MQGAVIIKNLTSIFKSLITAYALTGVLLLIAAFLMYKLNLGENQIRIFIMVIYGIATLAAGFIYGKLSKNARLLRGLLIGFLYFMFIAIMSVVVNRGVFSDSQKAVISMIICVLSGAIGAIMS